MDLESIKELMAAMEEQGMTRLALKDQDGFELELEKNNPKEVVSYHLPKSEPVQAAPIHKSPMHEGATRDEGGASQSSEVKEGSDITSPMVGTLYLSPSPDDPPFVKVGDSVKEDTVICIIEAMKVMNEVKAGKSGVVAEVYVDNASSVEFGTKLFRIV